MDYIQLPIIMTSMSRHDHLSSASLSLAKELSKSGKVFYINKPFTIKDKIGQKQKKEIFIFNNEYPNLYIVETGKVLPINFLPKGKLYRLFTIINDNVFHKAIKKILNQFKIGNNEFILFNSFNPFYGFLSVNKYPPKLIIYQSRDDIASAPYVKKHGVYLELDWIKRADLVYATGVALTEKLSKKSGISVRHLPNAADVTYFSRKFKKRVPESNIIGYLGEVQTRVDLELLERLALAFKDYIILMVGPCWDSIIEEFRLKCPNVVFAGFRKFDQIPELISTFRCAIIPFLKNELTRNIYPLKINEYLACGLPVVTTDFSPDLASFKEVISISRDYEDFIGLVEKSIKSDRQEKRKIRIDFAEQNSWSTRTEILLKDINRIMVNRRHE